MLKSYPNFHHKNMSTTQTPAPGEKQDRNDFHITEKITAEALTLFEEMQRTGHVEISRAQFSQALGIALAKLTPPNHMMPRESLGKPRGSEGYRYSLVEKWSQ